MIISYPKLFCLFLASVSVDPEAEDLPLTLLSEPWMLFPHLCDLYSITAVLQSLQLIGFWSGDRALEIISTWMQKVKTGVFLSASVFFEGEKQTDSESPPETDKLGSYPPGWQIFLQNKSVPGYQSDWWGSQIFACFKIISPGLWCYMWTFIWCVWGRCRGWD